MTVVLLLLLLLLPCRNYGGSRSIVITIQGQKRADGRRYGQFS
jgi:hypothetical protein